MKHLNFMKRIFSLPISLLLTFGLGIGIANASTTITADNDSTTYKTWTDMVTSSTPAFAYGTGSGNLNNDYRISTYVNDHYLYHWDVPVSSAATYFLSVYLNNINFTNRGAQYNFGVSTIGTINQYSAPGGWNNVGSGYDWSTIHVTVDSYDNGSTHPASTKTGADAVQIFN